MNNSPFSQDSPLELAIAKRHFEIVQELLKHPDIDEESVIRAMKQLSKRKDSLEVKAKIGAHLCNKGNFHPSEHLKEEKNQELISKICEILSPKKSARN